MGLLEQMLARLDRLEQKAGITDTVAATPAAPASPLPTAAEVTANMLGTSTAPATPVAPADTALINDAGIPWHPDHHAVTKTQNNDGSWKAKKGGDKAAREAYEAQFIKPATAPATPAAPSTPAAPAAPGVPAPNAVRTEAIRLVKSLTDDYKVSYDNVIKVLLTKHGVDSFGALKNEHDEVVKNDARAWVEKLAQIDESIELLGSIDQKTGGAHNLPANIATVLSNAGGSAKLGEIAFDKLDATVAAIGDYTGQWKTWFEQSYPGTEL